MIYINLCLFIYDKCISRAYKTLFLLWVLQREISIAENDITKLEVSILD